MRKKRNSYSFHELASPFMQSKFGKNTDKKDPQEKSNIDSTGKKKDKDPKKPKEKED